MYTAASYSRVRKCYRSATSAYYVIEGVATLAFIATLLLYRYIAHSTFPDVTLRNYWGH
jgi:hypothetical protein